LRPANKTTNDLFAFVTTEPNAVVAPIRPKAMPMILNHPEQIERWMMAPIGDALALQQRAHRGATCHGRAGQ
jgi:putative SOS response-associated peptidase YedK